MRALIARQPPRIPLRQSTSQLFAVQVKERTRRPNGIGLATGEQYLEGCLEEDEQSSMRRQDGSERIGGVEQSASQANDTRGSVERDRESLHLCLTKECLTLAGKD